MFTSNCNKILFLSIIVLLFCYNKSLAQAKAMGEPVPGAEVYIELEPDDEPFAKGKTDHLGTYHFKNLKKGTYRLVCKPPKLIDSLAKKAELTKAQKRFINFFIDGMQKGPITFGSKTGKNPLLFESPEFILNEKENSLKVTIIISPNNYGINDEGLK